MVYVIKKQSDHCRNNKIGIGVVVAKHNALPSGRLSGSQAGLDWQCLQDAGMHCPYLAAGLTGQAPQTQLEP
jgi:hypothetical protein